MYVIVRGNNRVLRIYYAGWVLLPLITIAAVIVLLCLSSGTPPGSLLYIPTASLRSRSNTIIIIVFDFIIVP